MAKIKKRNLSWRASDSSQVVGYKLYWSENSAVNYNSNCKMLGNVTEITLPDDVPSFKPNSGPITLGVTAVDELGNESDMVTLAAPYQFNVPKAPDDLYLKTVNDYYTSDAQQTKTSDDKEVNDESPVKSKKVISQLDFEQHGSKFEHHGSKLEHHGEKPDLSTNLKLIEKEALAF